MHKNENHLQNRRTFIKKQIHIVKEWNAIVAMKMMLYFLCYLRRSCSVVCGNLVLKQSCLLWLLLSICFRRGNVNFLKAILTKQTNKQTNLQTNKLTNKQTFCAWKTLYLRNQNSHTRTKRIITSFARDNCI